MDMKGAYPIHREAPKFDELSTHKEMLATGITVIDLLEPYMKGCLLYTSSRCKAEYWCLFGKGGKWSHRELDFCLITLHIDQCIRWISKQ